MVDFYKFNITRKSICFLRFFNAKKLCISNFSTPCSAGSTVWCSTPSSISQDRCTKSHKGKNNVFNKITSHFVYEKAKIFACDGLNHDFITIKRFTRLVSTLLSHRHPDNPANLVKIAVQDKTKYSKAVFVFKKLDTEVAFSV